MTTVRHSIHFVPTADRKRVVITGSFPNEANSDSWPSAVLLWDPAGSAAPVSLQQYPASYYYAAQSPDGRTVAVVAPTQQIHFYDSATRELVRTFPSRLSERWAVFSPDGKRLATVGSNRGPMSVCIYDVETGRVEREFAGAGQAQAAAFSPDGTTLISGLSGRSI